jgi:bla regulator protein blaR1
MTPDAVLLFNHLWQSTLVGLAGWLLCESWLRNHRPGVRFGVWMAVSIKFLVPFAWLARAGSLMEPIRLLTPAQSQQIFDTVSASRPAAAAAPFATAHAPQAPTDWVLWGLGAAVLVWAAGAALVVARWAMRFRQLVELRHDAQPMGRYRGVAVMRSRRMHEEHVEPGVVGIWRQAILIPSGIEATLTRAQLSAVLNHEWQHVRRRDNLSGLIHTIVQGLFWFHPLVWVVARHLSAERELACDAAVLESADPDDYAEGILNVVKFYWNSAPGFSTGIASADLKARIELIMGNKPTTPLGSGGRLVVAATLTTMLVAPVLAGWLTAQAVAPQNNSFLGIATTAEKTFDVATIKPNKSGSVEWRLGPPGRGQISIVNMSMIDIITQSFRTSRPMVFGGPDWIRSTNFDIVGRGPDAGVGNPEVWEMMRSLLIERLRLRYHVEEREMPVYVLTQARGGHKLTLGENGFCAPAIKEGRACGDIMIPPFGIAVNNMPIGSILSGLARRTGRPVIERTGLTGRYDVRVMFLPDGERLEGLGDLSGVPAEFRPQDMGLFEAMEKQAGLKLEPARERVHVLVLDSVEQPGEN